MSELYYNKPDAELKNQKSLYQEKKYKRIQKMNAYLFIVYYIIVAIAILFIYFKYDMKKYAKHIIVVFLLLFPYIIFYVEKSVYDTYRFIYSLVYSKPFVEFP
jgi:glycopeptide antibiotics resistance protein